VCLDRNLSTGSGTEAVIRNLDRQRMCSLV